MPAYASHRCASDRRQSRRSPRRTELPTQVGDVQLSAIPGVILATVNARHDGTAHPLRAEWVIARGTVHLFAERSHTPIASMRWANRLTDITVDESGALPAEFVMTVLSDMEIAFLRGRTDADLLAAADVTSVAPTAATTQVAHVPSSLAQVAQVAQSRNRTCLPIFTRRWVDVRGCVGSGAGRLPTCDTGSTTSSQRPMRGRSTSRSLPRCPTRTSIVARTIGWRRSSVPSSWSCPSSARRMPGLPASARSFGVSTDASGAGRCSTRQRRLSRRLRRWEAARPMLGRHSSPCACSSSRTPLTACSSRRLLVRQ